MKSKKILHAVCMSSATDNVGVLNQLEYERQAVESLSLDWDIVFWSSDKSFDLENSFLRKLPWFVKGFLLRRLFFSVYLILVSNKYSRILVRYPISDPFFPIVTVLCKNIITVHHSKEVETISTQYTGIIGFILLAVEKLSGKISLNQVAGIIAVTNEIGEYEIKRSRVKNIPFLVSPNGIIVEKVELADSRDLETIKIIFISSRFYPWIGLEDLIDSILNTDSIDSFELHIVGSLSCVQQELIKHPDLIGKIYSHGVLSSRKIKTLISQCHVGLATFNWKLAGLSEACTLKVREYLSSGLPVYSGHTDSGLPPDFPYYCIGEADINKILVYAKALQFVSREEVYNSSKIYIDKNKIILNQYEWLNNHIAYKL